MLMELFERAKIGNVELKNRFAMAPMGTKLDADNTLDERCIPYYEERALGGFGLIITGGFGVTDVFEPQESPVLDNPKAMPRVSALIDRVHHAGGKICLQLSQGVGRNNWFVDGRVPKSASDCDWFWKPGVKCIPFEKEEIKVMVDAIAKAAKLSKAAGADMVLITAYGGYLMDQFLSSLWNTRTDEYGGSLENRMRFLKDSYDAIRAAVGPDFPILIKYTLEHNLPGGRTLNEGIQMGLEMEKWGAAALIVDLGSYDRWYLPISTVYSPEGYHVYLSRALKDAGVKIPIMSSGNQKNPEVARHSVESGDLDFVLLGHQSKADPYYPNKLKHGHPEDILPCIGCNECLMGGQKGGGIPGCAVNPLCYHEFDYMVMPAKEKKNVLVIGAGPGGAVAALTANSRGHQVQIWEKSNEIGGNLKAAGAPSFKKPVQDLLNYYKLQLNKACIPVFYNKEATVAGIKNCYFDHIICASGSTPVMPPIPGIKGTNVITSDEAFLGAPLKGDVVVIGGGVVGCEAAAHIAQTAGKVTVIELMDDVLKTVEHSKNVDQALRFLMEEAKVDLHCGANVTKIEDKSVAFEKDGKSFSVPCDNVVIAVGYKADTKLVEELKDNFDCEMLDIIGDASKVSKVYNAVHQGFHAARQL